MEQEKTNETGSWHDDLLVGAAQANTVAVDSNAVDAVFVIGTGSRNHNEELKYALRNLEKNCPFIRNVYISGECPDWVNTSIVHHIQWPDRFKHAKDANIIDKLFTACSQPGIAKKILFCSDDQFQTRVCSWNDFSPRWVRKYSSSDSWYASRNRIWHMRLRNTLERERERRAKLGLDETSVFYFQPHMWMQIDRDQFIDYANWCNYATRDDTIIASGYFNYIQEKGCQNFDHVFIRPDQPVPCTVTHIAYTDASYARAMTYLRQVFSRKSMYEKGGSCRLEYNPTASVARLPTNTGILELPSIPFEPEDAKFERIKNSISSNRIWHALAQEVYQAEMLRTKNSSGWRIVWLDIAARWEKDTKNGNMLVPVTSKRSRLAEGIAAGFNMFNKEDVKLTESDLTNCQIDEEHRKYYTESDILKLIDTAHSCDYDVSSRLPKGCLHCAITHLSTAVAYLNSPSDTPDSLSIALAIGELVISMRHFDALGLTYLSTACKETLSTRATEASRFTADGLRAILKEAIDTVSRCKK